MINEKKICVIIPAKNSAKYLPTTLMSLVDQTLSPIRITVVDDGSNDETSLVAKENGAITIRLPDIGYYAVGTPHIAKVINTGIQEALNFDPDYIMISGSDDIFPERYIEELVTYMEDDEKLVIASGYVDGEPWNPINPRGGGRFFKAWFFKKIGLYPLKFGWETYPVVKAWTLNLKTKTYPTPFYTQRSSIRNPIKYYYLGKGMKILGYSLVFSLARILLVFLSSRKSAVLMLVGYFSTDDKYEDIAEFTSILQKRRIINYIKNPKAFIEKVSSRF